VSFLKHRLSICLNEFILVGFLFWKIQLIVSELWLVVDSL
jgi:hypothetical protein